MGPPLTYLSRAAGRRVARGEQFGIEHDPPLLFFVLFLSFFAVFASSLSLFCCYLFFLLDSLPPRLDARGNRAYRI